eukprot:scaffold662351_cov51-Prasinocladus_malaysianus.AAC.2
MFILFANLLTCNIEICIERVPGGTLLFVDAAEHVDSRTVTEFSQRFRSELELFCQAGLLRKHERDATAINPDT